LGTILQNGILPGKKEWDRIRQYAKDKNPKVRLAAARILGMRCCEAHETMFEDIEENFLDIVQAKKLLKQIRRYIGNDLKSRYT